MRPSHTEAPFCADFVTLLDEILFPGKVTSTKPKMEKGDKSAGKENQNWRK